MKRKIRLLALFCCVLLSSGLGKVVKLYAEQTEFILFNNSRATFEEAIINCDKENATLARVSNISEFDFIDSSFGIANGSISEDYGVDSFWIGLYDKSQEQTKADDTSRFSFVDNSTNNLSFFAEPHVFPWKKSQPNNYNGRQFCIRWAASTNLWADLECDNELNFLCRRTIESKNPADRIDTSRLDRARRILKLGLFISSVGGICILMIFLIVHLRRKQAELKLVQEEADSIILARQLQRLDAQENVEEDVEEPDEAGYLPPVEDAI